MVSGFGRAESDSVKRQCRTGDGVSAGQDNDGKGRSVREGRGQCMVGPEQQDSGTRGAVENRTGAKIRADDLKQIKGTTTSEEHGTAGQGQGGILRGKDREVLAEYGQDVNGRPRRCRRTVSS